MTKLDNNQKKQTTGGAIGIGTILLVITTITSLVAVATSIASTVIQNQQINSLPPVPPEIHFSRNTLSTRKITH